MPSNVSAAAVAALVVAVVACASGGVWFLLLREAPPTLRASWRLAVTGALQLPGLAWEARTGRLDAETRERWALAMPTLAGTGVVLGVHFAAWSKSLDWTSLPHSLLFVCTTPLLIVGCKAVAFAAARVVPARVVAATGTGWRRVKPPTRLEALGAVVGFAAAGLLALDAAASEQQHASSSGSSFPTNATTATTPTTHVAPSVRGDAMAVLGAAAMGIYLAVGATVRTWLPLFAYVCPVTLSAAVFTAAVSAAFEPGSSFKALWGLFASPWVFGVVFGSAVTAGILGHTAANYAVPYVGSLAVSVALLWEPLVGSIMGAVLGLTPPPGPFTYAAGFPLMLSAMLVTWGARSSSDVDAVPVASDPPGLASLSSADVHDGADGDLPASVPVPVPVKSSVALA